MLQKAQKCRSTRIQGIVAKTVSFTSQRDSGSEEDDSNVARRIGGRKLQCIDSPRNDTSGSSTGSARVRIRTPNVCIVDQDG